MSIMRCIFSIIMLAATLQSVAQSLLEAEFEKLQTGSELPQELLTTRSAVFLKSPSGDSIEPIDWGPLAEELHKNLVAMQIDAVAYYQWQDLNAGFDATGSYLEAIRAREINQIVILAVDKGKYQIYLVPMAESPGLLATAQPVWHTSSNTLESAIAILATALRRTGLEVSNFLISDTPEFFVDTKIFRKNRFELFQPDLKLDKLAAPLFFSKDPENVESTDDLELGSMMQALYPFNYELVGAGFTEDLMKKAGFHYVLRLLHAKESTLKTLLDYADPVANASGMAYKFYIKHLITGDVYLGSTWDSQASWQQALNLHLTNMKKSLKVE